MASTSRLAAGALLGLLAAPLASQAQDESAVRSDSNEFEEIVVRGRAQEFYRVQQSKIGTKTEIDIMDLPQSVQILNERLIIDQAARNITHLYRDVAGVSEFSYSGVTFRGFRDSGNVFYDGVRGDPYSGFSVPQLFNVQRVEVLKGPVAALYGGGEPGGMINYVTKKPEFDSLNVATLTIGNYNLRGGFLESRSGLTDSIAYRIGGYYEDQEDFRNNADARNLELAGGLLLALGASTELVATFDAVDQDLGGNRLRGVPVSDDGSFLVDRSYNSNEESDFQNLEALVLQATLEHQFNDELNWTTTVRYLDNEREQEYHESRGWVDVNADGAANVHDQTIRREFRDQYRANKEISLTTDLVYDFIAAGARHQLVVGADFHDVDTEYEYLRARYEADGVANLNIFDLNYGVTDSSAYRLTDLGRDGAKSKRYSVYAQDRVPLGDRWILMGGVRWDNFENIDKASGFAFDDSNAALRGGVVFKPSGSTSLYLNYSESFNPMAISTQSAVSNEGSLNPETGRQWELGVKQELMDGAILTTLAVYDIDKRDIALRNPNDTGPDDDIPAFFNIGAVRSRGAEFTLVGDLARNWTVTANYAYNDTRVIKGVTIQNIRNTFGDGSRFVNAPEHQGGVWTRVDFPAINSAVAFGLGYVGEQISFSNQRVKPFTVCDLGWTSVWNDVEIQVNVKNLFDKSHAISGFIERTGHFPGAPREIVVQARYSF